MKASVITRVAGTMGLIGLAPIAYTLATGARTLPEAAVAATLWAGGIFIVSFVARLLLEHAATNAERVANAERRTGRTSTGPAQPSRSSARERPAEGAPARR